MQRPDLELTIGDQTIKMTYGLQSDLQRVMPDVSQVLSLLTTDPYLRDWVVRRALTKSTKSIEKEEDLISHDEITLDPDEILVLLDWVAEHLTYFFGKSAGTASRLGTEYQEQLARLLPSTTGSQTSPSTTQSAGDSESSKDNSPNSTSA